MENDADGDGEVSGGFSSGGDSDAATDDEIEISRAKLPREREQSLELFAGKFNGGNQTRI